MRTFLNKFLAVFSRRKYLNKNDRIGFSKRTSNQVRKEVDKIISNNYKNALKCSEAERTKRVELDVLIEIMEENPNYYTKEELNLLLHEIVS